MNYFEILKLPCEGTVSLPKMKAAFEKWSKELDVQLSDASVAPKTRNELLALEKERTNIEKMLKSDADGEKLRKEQQAEYLAICTDRMKKVLSVMTVFDGPKRIRNTRATAISKDVGLSSASVQKYFEEAGYEIVKGNQLETKDFLLDKSVWEKFNHAFFSFRNVAKENPLTRGFAEHLAEIEKMSNIYEYAAIYDSYDIQNWKQYQNRDALELKSLFEKWSTQYAQTDAASRAHKEIVTNARTIVFSDDAGKKKYDARLRLEALREFRENLEVLPESIKLDRQFANGCISKIQEYVDGRDQAIAVYNEYAALTTVPYEDEDTNVYIRCACGAMNVIDSYDEALRSPCKICGTQLFVTCPSCGKKTEQSHEYCHACGFRLKAVHEFEAHFKKCADALRMNDVDLAAREWDAAKRCNPKEPRLADLEAKVRMLREKYKAELDRIGASVTSGFVMRARTELATFKRENPGVMTKDLETAINQKIAQAETLFARIPNAPNATNSRQIIDGCNAVLSIVKDHAPALNLLRNPMLAPKPVGQVICTADHQNLSCSVQWTPNAADSYVTYTVVRKENAFPQSPLDGYTVCASVSASAVRDQGLLPGKLYCYAVFSVRGDAVSKPACAEGAVCCYQSIRDFKIAIRGNSCILSWDDIPGSFCVIVERSSDGNAFRVVSQNAHASFSDSDIKPGCRYYYRLKTVWKCLDKYYASAAVTHDVLFEVRPKAPVAQLINCIDCRCNVQWKVSDGNGSLCFVALHDGITVPADQEIDSNALPKVGAVLVNHVSVSLKQCCIPLDARKSYRIAVMRSFGDRYVTGNTFAVSTYPGIQIAESDLSFSGTDLHMKIHNIPDSVTRVYYKIVPYLDVTSDDLLTSEMILNDNGNLDHVAVSDTTRGSLHIVKEQLPQTELLVSVVAMYGQGSDRRFSSPTTVRISNLPKNGVVYRIVWQTHGFMGRKLSRNGAILYVKTDCDRMPAMKLYCHKNGRMLYERGNISDLIELVDVPAQEGIRPGTEYRYELRDGAVALAVDNAPISLFLDPSEEKRYSHPRTGMNASVNIPSKS